MIRIKDITDHLEQWAPPAYAESYDNVGLLVGDKATEVSGIMVSLDCTEAVVKDAMDKGCNLIVSHHPILFKGLKKLTGANYVERTILMAIRNDIAIYAIHTNLDNVSNGVNKRLADRLGIMNQRILLPKQSALQKLTFFVPKDDATTVSQALFSAGAGTIGDYQNCSFTSDGFGRFTPAEGADPHIGKKGEPTEVSESRVEVMYPAYLQGKVVNALKEAHPYEEVSYFIHNLENKNQYIGSGIIGELSDPTHIDAFLDNIKYKMDISGLRHTKKHKDVVKRIAVCGGSGSFLLPVAKAQQADVFITADFKYHEFFDAEEDILIADIGHYESERFTIDLIAENIREKFSTFATHLTQVNTNPIFYY